jgi:aspartate kinase
MKVFKFGGASIKNAAAIRNMCDIIKNHQNEQLIVVVSAMGKSTNTLEEIHKLSLSGKEVNQQVNEFIKYHLEIANELFGDHEIIEQEIGDWRQYLEESLSDDTLNTNQHYACIVSVGELLSSSIIGHYLIECGISTTWTDVRKLILTDDVSPEANVDWTATQKRITAYVNEHDTQQVILTQGFVAANNDNQTTTLGREGSDYTGAIFASCLDAESFTVWKDVPGILNADPRRIDDAVLFDELSYNETSEMTYYGAKVIHPKTIKPLANKNIPLYVRCFDNPEKDGTKIHNCETIHTLPVIVFKDNQCLVSFKSKDLTFVNEKGISVIFEVMHDLSIDMSIMQNSAVSFSICIDYNTAKIEQLIEALNEQFDIRYNTDLELVTIKNYNHESIHKYLPKGEILLEQKSRSNYRVLVSK